MSQRPNQTCILTHRGLEPSQTNFFSESSWEAFVDQARRGFGLEFDVNFTRDGRLIIAHDKGLERVTKGEDKRVFAEGVDSREIPSISLGKGKIPFLEELLDLIRKSRAKVNALHLKGRYQKPLFLELIVAALKGYADIFDRLIIFDVTPETAYYLKQQLSGLQMAPSVAHAYDIKRYNSSIGQTMISMDDALRLRDLFTWVWLDEWDRTDKNGGEKKLYTKEVFEVLRSAGFKISLVTPELHGTSPGLYGGESHQDAANKEGLFKRIKEILELGPDALCTDYPEEVSKLLVK